MAKLAFETKRPGEVTLALTVEGQEEIRRIFETVYETGLDFGRHRVDTHTGLDHLENMGQAVDEALSDFFLKIAASVFATTTEEKDR